jgi:hypothetical protein
VILRPTHGIAILVLCLLPGLPTATAQEEFGALSPEAAEALKRYRDQLLSSAYYDPSDRIPELAFGPKRRQSSAFPPKADAHSGVLGASVRSCESCHAEAASNVHTSRGGATCRQCHGADPIASLDHYFSPMNPIRRHAYVCSKCHQGASASFATYVVHPPAANSELTRESFPALYWSEKLMWLLIVSVLLVFVPHGVAWWIREWFAKRRSEA